MDFLDKVLIEAAEANPDMTNKDQPPTAKPCPVCETSIEYIWRPMTSRRNRGVWGLGACSGCADQLKRSRHLDYTDELIARSGVPDMFVGWTTMRGIPSPLRDNLVVDQWNDHVRQRSQQYSPPGWVIFAGPVGVGKTTWASSLMCDLIDQRLSGKAPLWTTEAGLFRSADNAAAASHSARVRVLQNAIDASFLVLDDIGGSRRDLSPWQGGAMRDLIDERHSHKRPTLLTTNFISWDEVAKRYGDHIVSRMIGASKGMLLMEGPDRRLKK